MDANDIERLVNQAEELSKEDLVELVRAINTIRIQQAFIIRKERMRGDLAEFSNEQLFEIINDFKIPYEERKETAKAKTK